MELLQKSITRMVARLAALSILVPSTVFAAQQVFQVTWPTSNSAEPPALDEEQRRWLPAVQFAVASLPEEALISFALAQGSLFGLESAEARKLQTLFSNYYARVRQASSFRSARSALPYCLSETKPAIGLATVCVPPHPTTNSRTILFLHGYGGSLLAYAHFVANTFPNDVVICPAYGIAPAKIPLAYITESLAAASKRIGPLQGKPVLVGLSAGGEGACRVYATNPEFFDRLICLGSIPPADAVMRFDSRAKLSFLSGSREPHVIDGSFARQLSQLRKRVRTLSSETIAGADHYFLLSHEQETRKALLKAMQR